MVTGTRFEVNGIASSQFPRPLVIKSVEDDQLNGPRGMDNDLPYVEELRRAYSLPGADDRL